MDSLQLIEKLEICPIIAAVHEDKFGHALQSPSEIIFLLEGDVMTVGEKIAKAHENGKLLFIHIDLMKGIGKDRCGVQFLANLGAVKYGINECTNPTRTVTSIVRVANRVDTMVSVKTENPIPKGNIFDLMEIIRAKEVNAPIEIGDVICDNVFGTKVIATKQVK